MDSKICSLCNIGKNVKDFRTKIENEMFVIAKNASNVTLIIKIKYQTNENFIMQKRRYKLLQKQNDRYIDFTELLRSYVKLENRLKALEENFSINDSENNQNFYS